MDCAVPMSDNIVPFVKRNASTESAATVAPPVKTKGEPNMQGRVLREFSTRWQYTSDSVKYSDIFHSVVKGVFSFNMGISPWVSLPKLGQLTFEADRLLDGIRFLTYDFKNILNLHYYNDYLAHNYAELTGHLSMMVSNFGGMMNLAGHLNIINLNHVAMGIGKLTVFGRHLPKITTDIVIGTFALEFQTAAFFCMGVQALYDIVVLGNDDKRKRVWLLTCVAEVAHKLFMIAFVATMSTPLGLVTAGVLGVIANGLGGWEAYSSLSDPQGAAQGHGPK